MNVPASAVAQQLQSAARLLQTGDLARASALLEQLLIVHPGLPDAYWLLAGVRMRRGEFEAAERAATTAVQLMPRNPSAHALLGEILACRNRMDDAERAIQQALKLAPSHPQAISLLLRVLLAQSRHEELLRRADEFIARGWSSHETLSLRAQALLLLRRMPEAVDAFRKVLAVQPGDIQAELGLTSAQIGSGQAGEAESSLRALIDEKKDGPEVRYTLARALLSQQRYQEAEAELRRALVLRPDFADAHTNLAELIWMRTGDSGAATVELDAALRAQPGNAELRVFKAKLLEWAGDAKAALAELERGLAFVPGHPNLHLAAAQTGFRCDPPAALRHAERALQLATPDTTVLSAYGNALLANGRAEESARVSEEMLKLNPHEGHAIALRASAWRVRGDPRYGELYDYGHFVRAGLIDVPSGWPSLSDYLRDLSAALHKRHLLNAHPIGQTLRTGTQVDLDLEHESDPAIRAFAQAIDGPIRRYMQAIGPGNDVLRSRNAKDYKITGIWSVRLRAQGHHVNHYHPDGWLSSACYIELPETLGAKDGEGWIKFGESGIPTQPPLEAEYFVKPEPGLLVLFPSWMWHGTVPFSGGEQDRRLTIAFDVVPVV